MNAPNLPSDDRFSSPYDLHDENFTRYDGAQFSRIILEIKLLENGNTWSNRIRERLRALYRAMRCRFDLRYAIRSIAFSDTISMSDLPLEFHQNFLAGSHPYGITLSVDQIGSECWIGQNSTFGANHKYRNFDEGSAGYKPRLGHFVTSYPGALVSGPVSIGHCTVLAANSVVTRDVPSFSLVSGVNEVRQLSPHHYKIFLSILRHQLIVGRRPTVGLVYSKGEYFQDHALTDLKKNFVELYKSGRFDAMEFTQYFRRILN